MEGGSQEAEGGTATKARELRVEGGSQEEHSIQHLPTPSREPLVQGGSKTREVRRGPGLDSTTAGRGREDSRIGELANGVSCTVSYSRFLL